MELIMTATIKAEEEAIRQAIEEQQKKERQRAYTLRYCEKLGEQLEAIAETGKTPKVIFYCGKWDTRPLAPTYNDYADKRLSYRTNGESLDLELMAEWFAQYCFCVSIKEYGYYTYGCGYCSGLEVLIAPDPECIK